MSLKARLIPCLDVRDGRVVKGVQFKGLRDAGDPVELAARYCAQGADELMLLDIAATPAGRSNGRDVVRRVREVTDIALSVGGGVRSLHDASALLDAGADKISLNSAAIARPKLITELAEQFGSQCAVVAVDAAGRESGSWEAVIRSGTQRTGLDAVDWARTAVERGAGEILLTSFDRDGTRSGYDLELIRAVCESVRVPVIASGGAANAAHFAAALGAGASAVLAASIFHDGETTVESMKQALVKEGLEVRL